MVCRRRRRADRSNRGTGEGGWGKGKRHTETISVCRFESPGFPIPHPLSPIPLRNLSRLNDTGALDVFVEPSALVQHSVNIVPRARDAVRLAGVLNHLCRNALLLDRDVELL